ncbi:MAG: alpha/beta fold hydrolase [Elusimicrobia bacterium]|nr:alpha/beta fold hydrolase [Elusimicrobiota bacterium]
MGPLPLLALLLTPARAETVRFKTDDGWTICASYQAPKPGRPVAILVHGVAAGKSEWQPLTAELAKRGIGSLALDLRGHGESLAGPSGKTDFAGFDASQEWPKAVKDIEAAAAYLQKRGIKTARLGYIGASIGANLASWAKPSPRWLALLSPGADYRGVILSRPTAGLAVLVAASPPDAYAFQTAAAYARQFPSAAFLKAGHGHGAQMLSEPEFLKGLADWIEAHSR